MKRKNRNKKLSKKQKILIGIIVPLVLVVLTLTILFSCFNRFKFLLYTDSKFDECLNYCMSSNVKFVAHRGYCENCSANTEAAFLAAAEKDSFYGIETDVWVTSDGGYVCMHDKDSLYGVKNVRDVDFITATTTPLNDDKNSYASSLESMLNICKQYNKVAFIELKDENISKNDVENIINLAADIAVKIKIISFDFDKLKYAKEIDNSVEIQLLCLTLPVNLKKIINLGCELSCEYDTITKVAIKKFHNAGLKVGVWTMNNVREVICCIGGLNVDYVTTDKDIGKAIEEYE